jgi:hypothetical protein
MPSQAFIIRSPRSTSELHDAPLDGRANDNEPPPRSSVSVPGAMDAGIAFNFSHFWHDAGHARGCFVRPPADEDRLTWSNWLKAGAVLYSCLIGFGILFAIGSPIRPAEATAKMEQLLVKAQLARAMPRETAGEIESLINQRWFDCTQVACSAKLEARNREVRRQLFVLLARKGGLNEANAAMTRPD